MRQKETSEVEPRYTPKNNSQELPGPLPSLRGERPWCWTPASIVGYLLRRTALREARDGDDSVCGCGHECECASFTLADELLAEHPSPLCL